MFFSEECHFNFCMELLWLIFMLTLLLPVQYQLYFGQILFRVVLQLICWIILQVFKEGTSVIKENVMGKHPNMLVESIEVKFLEW